MCFYELSISVGPVEETHAAAGGDGDLHGVTSWLTHLLQVERLMGGFVVSSFNAQRSCIHTHLTQKEKEKK